MSDTRVAARPYFIGPGSTFFVTTVSTSVTPVGFSFVTANGANGLTVITTSGTDTRGANLIVSEVSFLSIRSAGMTDSNGNTWLPLGLGGFNFDAIQMWYCFNPVVSSNHTFSAVDASSTGQSIFAGMNVAAFAGATANSTIDQDVGGNGVNALTNSASAITPTQNNELIVAALVFGSGGSGGDITAISDGFTIASQKGYSNNNFQGAGIAYKIQTTAATEDPVWTIDTQYDMVCRIACWRNT